MKYLIFIILFLIPLVSSLGVNIPIENSAVNNNTLNVNNTQYWNSQTYWNMSSPFYNWLAGFFYNYNQTFTGQADNSSWNETRANGLYAKYNFTTNNFNGTGTFITTNTITGEQLTSTDDITATHQIQGGWFHSDGVTSDVSEKVIDVVGGLGNSSFTSTGQAISFTSGQGIFTQSGGGTYIGGYGGGISFVGGAAANINNNSLPNWMSISAGSGGGYTIATGKGTSITSTTNNVGNVFGGIGGAILVTGGNGGNVDMSGSTTGSNAIGGSGATFTFRSGSGASAFSKTISIGGAGGAFSFTGGTGGATQLYTCSNGQSIAGNGANMAIIASFGNSAICRSGNTCTNSNFTGGTGGSITFTSGQGLNAGGVGTYIGTTYAWGGNAGNISFVANNGGTATGNNNLSGAGGNILFQSGKHGVTGNDNIDGDISFKDGYGNTLLTLNGSNNQHIIIPNELFFSNKAEIYSDGVNLVFQTNLTTVSNTTTGLAWFSGNVSAKSYITRTSVYDKSKGSALSYVKDADSLMTDGKLDDSKFFGAVQYSVTDYSKSVEVISKIEQCSAKLDKDGIVMEVNGTVIQECKLVDKIDITYPFTKLESGVDLGKEVDVLRQALSDIKDCTSKSADWKSYQECVAK